MGRFLAFLIGCAVFGQSPADLPQFDVASVKVAPNDPAPGAPGRPSGMRMMSVDGGPGTDDPGQFVCIACPLPRLITMAYEVSSSQIDERRVPFFKRYDIVAKVPRGSTRHDMNLMLQQLLAERFQLKLHREKRPGTVFALVMGKQEPVLQRAGGGVSGAILYPVMTGNHLLTLAARDNSMQQLADAMSMFTDAPVVDLTGLHGGYDFTLYWLPTLRGDPILTRPKKNSWPPGMKRIALRVEDAVRQQLGLQLETRKLPTDYLVVDFIASEPVPD